MNDVKYCPICHVAIGRTHSDLYDCPVKVQFGDLIMTHYCYNSFGDRSFIKLPPYQIYQDNKNKTEIQLWGYGLSPQFPEVFYWNILWTGDWMPDVDAIDFLERLKKLKAF